MSKEEAKIDFFELGDKTSLICGDETMAEALRSSLRDLKYKFHIAETGEMAIERMRYTSYDLIVIQEDFAGSSLRSNVVLNYLASLSMAHRRNSFVCLIGESFKTLDAMQAFAHSVHLVVNPGDLVNFTAVVKKGLAEFQALYRIYNETLTAHGAQ